ncbi:MAG: ribonuclease P protein component [Desulfococcaceae bacterium]|nr:ribonuclease P protein component [Desulfococcaceae bacterium]
MPKYSFCKSDRIVKRAEFVRLSKSGLRIRNRYFIANCSKSGRKVTRLGLTVSKKVGNAVTRNRMKRLCRECFRLYRHNITETRDINIVVTKEAANLPTDQFFSSLQKLFDRVGSAHH